MGDFLERLKKRIAIQKEINEIRHKIGVAERIKSSLTQLKLQMNAELDCWNEQYAEYIKLDLAPDIKVVDSFEGQAAEQLALDFPVAVTEINDISGQISEVVTGVDDQIAKIDEYIEKLNAQIATLLSRLEAL